MRFWLATAILTFALHGCASRGVKQPAPERTQAVAQEIRRKLTGVWEYQYEGATVQVTYTRDAVQLAGMEPVPYTLSGDRITIDISGPQTSKIEFKTDDVMVQTNTNDGQQYEFRRKK